MKSDGTSSNRHFESIRPGEAIDCPEWLMRALIAKNPRLKVALAYSAPFTRSALDKKLLGLTRLN